MEPNPAVMPGDGLGPEVTTEALNVLEAVSERFDHGLNFSEGLIGGVAIDTLGKALSYETLNIVVGYAKVGSEGRTMSDIPRPNWRGE